MIRQTILRIGPAVLLAAALHTTAGAQGPGGGVDRAAVALLRAETGSEASVDEATGSVRFVRLHPQRATARERRAPGPSNPQEKQQRAASFLSRHRRAFGLRDAGEDLALLSTTRDAQGHTHLAYGQRYAGVPVFGALLRVHFDPSDALVAVNGRLVPEIEVDPVPSRSAEQAARIALASVQLQTAGEDLAIGPTQLMLFREGLAKGVPGENHLAWEVEIGNGSDVREFVYVDAHTGKIVDQITGIHDGLYRRAYDAGGSTAPGPDYPDSPFWVEGQAFPTASVEADNAILASGETYDLFEAAFGRDSFDAHGAILASIFNRGNSCPNASWNGIFVSFCPGVTSDDVTGHEWGHAYTEYSHNLIYQWQPGALNESYSDIWGEVVDQINGRGTDAPDGLRTPGRCAASSPAQPRLDVNFPASLAGSYDAQGAQFGPALTSTGTTGDLVQALDAEGSATDACSELTNPADVVGKLALVGRGACEFSSKVYNAQQVGAIGVVIANNVASGLPPMAAGLLASEILIPSVGVTRSDGKRLEAALAEGVNATLRTAAAADDSYRWLMAEDAAGFGGAIRDMWNPSCYANPGKVSDTAFYRCSSSDSGGVHVNSGVPNHAFALLVDGGSYNGRTVAAIGLTKAAQIYYRAQSVYQTPTSDFADHADALEASCADLSGATLADLTTGASSGEVITARDCVQVAEAALAVELRTPPTICRFQPLLAKSPPDRCDPATTTQVDLFADDFEGGAGAWSVDHIAASSDFTPRDWVLTSSLPERTGSGFFAADPDIGTCQPGGDESGVLYLTSPAITLARGVTAPRLSFDHWLATEAGWDGGNLQISVNDGEWVAVAPPDFSYNSYNATLVSAPDNTNPLSGERAWSGLDGGSVTGSWGRSQVELARYAAPGSSVRLRWALGTDGCTGVEGWYVDDVTVYACTSRTPPGLRVDDVRVTEGHHGFSSGAFTVSLSHAYAELVAVRYRLAAGTARRGTDFVPYAAGPAGQRSVEIPALSLSVGLPLRIRGDRQIESDEAFSITLLAPVNASIEDATGVCTILNDDGGP